MGKLERNQPTLFMMRSKMKLYVVKRISAVLFSIVLCLTMAPMLPKTSASAADTPEAIAIDADHFPDESFCAYVKERFDKDQNDELSSEEIGRAKSISLYGDSSTPGGGVKDLKGIVYFTELTSFGCDGSLMEQADFSQNNNITSLNISNTPNLTTLKTGNNEKIYYIKCINAPLESVDLSGNIGLTSINFTDDNNLKSLDLSNNLKLNSLLCDNTQLSTLNLDKQDKLQTLQCSGCKLTELNLSGKTKLWRLRCNNNQLNTLNVSHDSALSELRCENNNLTKAGLNMQGTTNLRELQLSGNEDLGNWDVRGYQKLNSFRCSNTGATQVDVSRNPEITTLQCANNQLESLDVSQNVKLGNLDCSGNKLSDLDLSQNPKLYYIYCSDNNLTDLDVSQSSAVIRLNCKNNKLRHLNIGNNSKLWEFFCDSNQLMSVDVAAVQKLDTIDKTCSQTPVLHAAKTADGKYVVTLTEDDPNLSLAGVSDLTSTEGTCDTAAGTVTFSSLEEAKKAVIKYTYTSTPSNTANTKKVEMKVNATVDAVEPLSVSVAPSKRVTNTGSTVTLTAKPQGGLRNYTYKWYKGDTELTGETERVLKITAEKGTSTYRVEVNDTSNLTNDTAVTATADVKATDPLSVSVDPADATALVGNDVKLTATAGGGEGGYTYQWYKDDEELSGETGNTLTIKAEKGEHTYTVKADDTSDETTDNPASTSAKVTGLAPLEAKVTPAKTYLKDGQHVLLTAEPAEGSGNYTYKWYEDGKEIDNATRNKVTVKPEKGEHTYKVVVDDDSDVTDAVEAVSTVTVMDVYDMDVSLTSSRDLVAEGNKVKLKSHVSGGSGQYSYQWYDNDTLLKGENGASAVVTSTIGKHTYKVTVTDETGLTEPVTASVEVTVTATPLLNLKVKAKGKHSQELKWNKIDGATGYDVYFAMRGNKMKHYKTYRGTGTTKRYLKKNTCYKYQVKAFRMINGKKVILARSLTCHTFTGNSSRKYTSAKRLAAKKKSLKLRVGKTASVSAKTVKYVKHRKLLPKKNVPYYRYRSNHLSIATVSSSGKITAKKAGTCKIYIYAQDGIYTTVNVTVK